MSNDLYDEAIEILSAGHNSTRLSDLIKIMEELGYRVKKTSSGNHWVFNHDGDVTIRGNFNGGHGANPYVKSCYIKTIIKTIKQLKAALSNTRENNDE